MKIIHHTALEHHGGAVRVARLLHEFFVTRGLDSQMSFEIAAQSSDFTLPPEAVGTLAQPDTLLHIHSTTNWTSLLESIPDNANVMVTLHDAGLFTGGCTYPIDCPHLKDGCPDPCPREFPETAATRQFKLDQLQRITPRYTAPSKWLAKLAEQHISNSKVEVIPNGIPWPSQMPSRKEARRSLGIHPAARVALFVAHGGENAVYKRGSIWKSMWNQISSEVPAALAFAVGGTETSQQDNMIRWPYVDREKLLLLMTAADVFLYPTVADNHPLVILEAMSVGTPAISFAVGGVPEQIDHDKNGLLLPIAEIDGMTQAAITLLNDPVKCKSLGQRAFEDGLRKFHEAKMAARYISLIKS